jgi:hypothetical protein
MSTSYATNDAVQSGGSAWVAKLANTGVVPVEGASWTMLAQKGDTPVRQGPTGATGPDGSAREHGPDGCHRPDRLTGRSRTARRARIDLAGGVERVSTSYATNDAVQSGGSAWVAKLANAGVIPTEGATWTILAQKGDTGPTRPDRRHRSRWVHQGTRA